MHSFPFQNQNAAGLFLAGKAALRKVPERRRSPGITDCLGVDAGILCKQPSEMIQQAIVTTNFMFLE